MSVGSGRALLCPLLLLLLTASSGCRAPATERDELPRYESTGKVIYVGAVYDLRSQRTNGEAETEVPALVRQRDVRIPASEIRSVLADLLHRSGLFDRVVNPPAVFAGDDPEEMIRNAQQSSDYLMVSELNVFTIKSLGFNASAGFSVPLDCLLGPFAFATYLTTAGNMYLFSGALVSCWTAEVVLSMSVSLIDTATGKVAHTIRIERRARTPFDGGDAFGTLWDESDDWVDLGRRLGEVGLHNGGVRLAAALGRILSSEPVQTKARKPGEARKAREPKRR